MLDPLPYLGYGLGLRPDHYPDIHDSSPKVDWFEAISENYMVDGGPPLYHLDRIAERWPVVLHGVSLGIGRTDPLDRAYLDRLKALADRVDAPWVSDHFCWTGTQGLNMHDLLPLPFTPQVAVHLADRAKRVQDHLGRPFALENASSYVTFEESSLAEWTFIGEVAEMADCRLLLDVNNVYVSGYNHGFDPFDFLDGIPAERVCQIHLAGHENTGPLIIDTHDAPVIDPVWELYGEALRRLGPMTTMIERDDKIPPLGELLEELDQARAIGQKVCGSAASLSGSS
ncbi:MAG: DUF692 domain-containing protein [Magnetovibrionaceae bacterium]